MRCFLLILFVRFSTLFAQSANTSCIKERWISIKPSCENEGLFPLKNIEHPELGLLNIISSLSFGGKISIHIKEHFLTSERNCFLVPIIRCDMDSIDKKSPINFNEYLEFLGRESTTPIANQFGEDSLTWDDEAALYYYMYPPREIIQLKISEISEIRIHEHFFFDSIKQENQFQPDAICFVSKSELKCERELFWIYLNDLFEDLENKEQCPWYNVLIRKSYKGEVYKEI